MGFAIISAMTTTEALAFFDGSATKLAAALGIDQSTPYSWKEEPPEWRQLQLEAMTGGKLKASPACDKFRAAPVVSTSDAAQ